MTRPMPFHRTPSGPAPVITTPKASPAADLLDKAADYIIRYGWLQGDRGRYAGSPACALGALSAVETGSPFGTSTSATGRAARRALRRVARHNGNLGIMAWNDTTGRTRTDVVNTMRCTAARLREA